MIKEVCEIYIVLLTIGHVVPLEVFPVTFLLNIVEFVLDIGGPGNVVVVDINLGVDFGTGSGLPELKGIIEETLGNESTWNSWAVISKDLSINILLLVLPEVLNLDNWITVAQFSGCLVLTGKLFVVS